MKCHRVKELIPEYLDGESGILKSYLIKRHIKKCRSCKSDLLKEIELKKILFLLGENSPSLSEEYYRKFEERFRIEKARQSVEEVHKREVFWSPARVLPSIAGVAVIIALGFFINVQYESFKLQREKEILISLDLYENLKIISNLDRLMESKENPIKGGSLR